MNVVLGQLPSVGEALYTLERMENVKVVATACFGWSRSQLKVHHGILLYYKGAVFDDVDLTISAPRSGILVITSKNQEDIDRLFTIEKGDAELFQALCDSIATVELYFNVMEP